MQLITLIIIKITFKLGPINLSVFKFFLYIKLT